MRIQSVPHGRESLKLAIWLLAVIVGTLAGAVVTHADDLATPTSSPSGFASGGVTQTAPAGVEAVRTEVTQASSATGQAPPAAQASSASDQPPPAGQASSASDQAPPAADQSTTQASTAPIQYADLADVEITLTPSRDNLVAGELWSVVGEIANRSKTSPIWIVDATTILMFAPEVYGVDSDQLSSHASFPTLYVAPGDTGSHSIRIDPGGSYAVSWRSRMPTPPSAPRQIQRLSSGRVTFEPPSPPPSAVLADPFDALREYMYFYPGEFNAIAVVHVWYAEPAAAADGSLSFDNSFVRTVTKTLPLAASPWVLIFGASLGAILCRTLQMLVGNVHPPKNVLLFTPWLLGGYLVAILLAAIGTVLLSRLSTTDFLVTVKVRDFWGSIATGFVIQWFGYPWLARVLPVHPGTSGTSPTTGTPSGGAAQGAHAPAETPRALAHAPAAAAARSDVRFAPRTLLPEQITAGSAILQVSADGLSAAATSGSVELVSTGAQRSIPLVAHVAAGQVSRGALAVGVYRVPETVTAGDYFVRVVTDDGQAVTSADVLVVAAESGVRTAAPRANGSGTAY